MEIPKELITINWTEALGQAGNDREFLFEVLDDLKNEMIEAISIITSCLRINDFAHLSRIAHRIKGSSAYLYCERLHYVSEKMQTMNVEDISDEMKHTTYTLLFNEFQILADELIKEIEAYDIHAS